MKCFNVDSLAQEFSIFSWLHLQQITFAAKNKMIGNLKCPGKSEPYDCVFSFQYTFIEDLLCVNLGEKKYKIHSLPSKGSPGGVRKGSGNCVK